MQGPGQLSVMGIVLVMVAEVLGTVNAVLGTVSAVLGTVSEVLGTVNASRTSQPQVQDSPGEADYTKSLVWEGHASCRDPWGIGNPFWRATASVFGVRVLF